jgi:hypothetical protein
MVRKRLLWTLVITGVVVILVMVVGNWLNISRAQFTPVGSYLIEVRSSDDRIGGGTMFATLMEDGQLMASTTGDFGANPLRCSEDRGADKFIGPGLGTWQREGLTIHFLMVANRFDQNGNPIGIAKAAGEAQASLSDTIRGEDAVCFYRGFDVFSPRSEPECARSVTFVATRLPMPMEDPSPCERQIGK